MKLIKEINMLTEAKRVPAVVNTVVNSLTKDDLKDEAKAKAKIEKLVTQYFSKEKWSLEKDEWETKMSAQDKKTFVSNVLDYAKEHSQSLKESAKTHKH